MDISHITDMYNSMVKDNVKAKTSVASTIDTARDYSKASDEELMDVCKKFEAYFLEQCFKEMAKTVGNEEEFSSSATSTLVDYYKENLIKEMSEQSTQKESLGLAQMLYDQMKRNYSL